MAQQLRILVVDDDPVTEFLFRDHLPAHVSFEFYSNPHQAASRLKEERFDYLITGIYMPQVSGLELGVWATQQDPNLKLIITSIRGTEEDRHQALAMGAIRFYKKPVDFNDLNTLLKGKSQGFEGSFRSVNLADLLQVIAMNNQGLRLFSLQNEDTGQKGYIFLQDGQVVHSEFRGLSYGSVVEGQDAFFQLLSFSNAAFQEVEWVGGDDYKRTIHVPLQGLLAEAAKRLDEERWNGPVKPQKLENILLVEDDEIVRSMLGNHLEGLGYQVVRAESAVYGAKAMKSQRFDLVISDINMPDITGMTFLSWIRTHYPECPVILMTAFQDPELEKVSSQMGCLRFLNKPFSLRQFGDYLRQLATQGLAGQINQIHILDLIQLALLTRARKRLYLKDTKYFNQAQIYIDTGSIVHAEYQGLVGEEAFMKIATIQNGIFNEEAWEEPALYSLRDIPPHKLLIRASQLKEQDSELKIDPRLLERIEKKLKFYY